MFSSEAWLANPGAGFYNGVATTSYRNEPTVVLTKEQDAPTSSKIMSMGGWIKRNKVGHYSNVFSGSLGGSGVPQAFMYIDNTNNRLEILCYNGSAYVFRYMVSRKFRDTSAWYHLWLQIDSTEGNNATADRVKIYVNGVRETTYDDTPTHIADGTPDIRAFNEDGIKQYFGHTNASYGGHLYYSDWYFIDGLAVSPVDTVGEFKNGVFIPKAYTPTEFGNNGFHLKFDQTGVGTPSATTIGADSSGKANHFTSTEGTNVEAHDCAMPDSPENNFATMNPLEKHADITLSEGNLKSVSSGDWRAVKGTQSIHTGKRYFEAYVNTTSSNIQDQVIGLTGDDTVLSGTSPYPQADPPVISYFGSGDIYKDGSLLAGSLASFSAGNVLGVAVDFDNSTVQFYLNNSAQSSAQTLPTADLLMPFHVASGTRYSIFNFGQDSSFAGNKTAQGNTDANGIGDFYYAPPSGYLALCTSNLPEPTIGPNADTQADDYFNTVLYSGSGSAQTINIGFSTDFTWIKSRGTANSHLLADSNRGSTKVLLSNGTNAEITDSNYTTFVSNGFSVSGNGSEINNSSGTYVSWNWKANGGTTSSNSDGSITSTVQANTTAGFSIVQFVGDANGSSNVGHGLSKTPNMVIVKPTSQVDGWAVYHSSLGVNKLVELHSTSAEQSSSGYWGSVTSSVFGLSAGGTNNRSGATHIAYCFAEIEGYSRFGSYTGNGNADGAFVYTGFRPAFIITKTSSHASSWSIVDTKRDPFNIVNQYLLAESSGAEGDFDSFDILSNGFKARTTNAERNGSGRTVIYMAFAEAPFKYANAR